MDTETVTPVEPTSTSAPAATAQSSVSSEPVKEPRPTSMRAAFERMEEKSKVVAASPGPATTRPTATSTDPTRPATPPTAPIPPDVHAKALDNARQSAVAEYRKNFGWAEHVPKAQFDAVAALVQRSQEDPIGYVLDVIADLEKHPTLGPQWKARQAPANGHQPANLDPDVEVMDKDGRVIGATFSAERVKAIVDDAVSKAIGKEVQPLRTAHEQRLAEEKRQQTEAKAAEHKKASEARANLEFDDIKGILEITEDEHPLLHDVMVVWGQHPDWSAHKAALEVRNTKVKPRQAGQAVQQATTEMQRKAAGNSANGTGTTAMPARPKTREELRQWMVDREAQAGRA